MPMKLPPRRKAPVPCETTTPCVDLAHDFAAFSSSTTMTTSTFPEMTTWTTTTQLWIDHSNLSFTPCADIQGRHNWIIKVPDCWSDEKLNELASKFPSKDKYAGHPSQRGLSILIVWASPDELARAFHQVPGVQYVEMDSIITTIPEADFTETESKDQSVRLQVPWGLDMLDDVDLDARYVASSTDAGRGAHIYVAGTGVRTTHAQFGGRAVPTIETVASSVKVCSSTDTDCATDENGYGTHIAGTAGGSSYGVAQGAWIHAVKVLTDDGKGAMSSLLMAMDWILVNGERPSVLLAPINGTYGSRVIKDAIDRSTNGGLAVVLGAGNDAMEACQTTPAYVPSALTVAASDEKLARAKWSNFGCCVDMFAPGVNVKTAGIKSDWSFAVVSGTSLAAAHAAGAAAILLSVWTTLQGEEVINTLKKQVFVGTLDAASRPLNGSPNRLLSVRAGLGLQEVIIGPSDSTATSQPMKNSKAKYQKKCVKAPVGIRCASNAGDNGQRLGHDGYKDSFKVTVGEGTVCAERIDNSEDDFLPDQRFSAGEYDEGGWKMNLRFLCHWKSAAAAMDKWEFGAMGDEGEANVCAGSEPTDRRSLYYARYDDVDSLHYCQELCMVHYGCRGFDYLPSGKCEVWLHDVNSFQRLPKGASSKNTSCMRMLGRGVPGSGVVRLASAPLVCLAAKTFAASSPLLVTACNSSDPLQQLSWEGVGAMFLTRANEKLCVGNVNRDVSLQNCKVGAEAYFTREAAQLFSFGGSGFLRWVGENQDDCLSAQAFTDGTHEIKISKCDATNPTMQFFY